MTSALRTILLAAVAIVTPGIASASTITINLFGNTANTQTGTTSSGTFQSLNLTDTATGGDVPGFTYSVGDVITGTVNFSTPFVIPGAASSFFYALNLGYTPYTINSTESFSYSLNGAPVSAPPQYMNFGGSGGFIAPGQYSTGPTPPFFFDQISYSYTVNGITSNGTSFNSASTTTTTPNFYVSNMSAVPEPAAWALTIFGLGVAGFVKRQRSDRARRLAYSS